MGNILLYRDVDDDGYGEVTSDHPLPVKLPYGLPYNTTSLTCAATANLTLVFPSECQLLGWAVFNHAATERLVRVYDKGSAAPVVANDAPLIKLRIGIPATATGAGSNMYFGENGLRMVSGLGFSITTVMTSDTDGTAPSAGDVLLNLFWRPVLY